ncbi:MAG: hypothetical protein QOI11_3385 [Candidatus Eremiobacteraeota bacterium]|jgi:hypothetical protein|nr:hypothetical protein [Candidatus Eremiobacteraeota bacterium]
MNATISSGTLLAPVPTGLVLRSAVPAVDRILRESNPALAQDADSVVVNRVVVVNTVWSRAFGPTEADFF